MAWVVDNASDEAVIECQKEIRRLRGAVRELQNEAEENKLVKRAVWKDHKVIGHLYLSDKQVNDLNSLKDIGIYVGLDETTEPEQYNN